jgi:hypothetical protein
MVFDRFIPEGAIFFLPETIPGWREMKKPVTSRFYSAHFCFTLGQFSTEVQHNPEYYFHGEEISIAARAYTFGYDLFHPHVPVVYHEYTRKGRTKQWDDDRGWGDRNKKSHSINRKLFGMDGETQEGHDGPFGFGTERTLRDYEIYSGILFEKRSVQKYTIDKIILQIHMTIRVKNYGKKISVVSLNIVSILDTHKYLKQIMIFGLLLFTEKTTQHYLEKMRTRMKLQDS